MLSWIVFFHTDADCAVPMLLICSFTELLARQLFSRPRLPICLKKKKKKKDSDV